MKRSIRSLSVCTVLAISLGAMLATPGSTQKGGQPIARYTVDAGTLSGMPGMGAGGGGMGAAMAMMRGGGGAQHELLLKLGSTRKPTGAPKGDHFIPVGMAMGKSLPLVTPTVRPSESGPAGTEMPRGRMLLFWGCGEHAGKGQPVVIDFSKLAKGQMPPNLYFANIPEEWQVRFSNSTTYGDWPNERERKALPARSSLLGAHRIASTYAPEIKFDLDTDFMAPLQVKSSALPSGAYAANWNAVPGATGYYAWVMSGKEGKGGQPSELVWWASSSKQAFGGPMWDWLSPASVAKLVADKTVMPPSQTSCIIPAEVKKAGGEALMASLYAYGPQRDFAYPPRPKDPKVAWNPEWITRVRFRSMSMTVLGMDMGAMEMGEANTSTDPSQEPAKPKCKGLKGIAMRAAGLCE